MSRLQKIIVNLFCIVLVFGSHASAYRLSWRNLEAGTTNVTKAVLDLGSSPSLKKSKNVVCLPINYTGSFAYYYTDSRYTSYVNSVTRLVFLLSPSHGSRQTLGVYDTISAYHFSPRATSNLNSLFTCVVHGQRLSSNENNVTFPGFSSLDWVAFRGPLVPGGITDEQYIPKSGRTFPSIVVCETERFFRPFNSTPCVFISLSHQPVRDEELDDHTDAIWIESVSKTGVTICVDSHGEENHAAVFMKWTAFESDKSLLPATIQNKIPNDFQFGSESFRPVTDSSIVAICIDKPFEKPFDLVPKVFGTIKFKNASQPSNLALQLWFETITTTGFRACIAKKSWETRDLSKGLPSIDFIAFHERGLYTQETERVRDSIFLKIVAKNIVRNGLPRVIPHRNDEVVAAFVKWARFLAEVHTSDLIRFEYAYYNGSTKETVIYFAIHGYLEPQQPVDERQVANTVINRLALYPKSSYIDAEQFVTQYLKAEENRHITISGDAQRDCAVSPFNWTDGCSQKTCGGSGGTLRAIRKILGFPTNNGRACPGLIATWPCNYAPCITSAQWGAWKAGGQSLFTSDSGGSSTTIIVVIVAVILISGIVFYFWYRNKNRRSEWMLAGDVRHELKIVGA